MDDKKKITEYNDRFGELREKMYRDYDKDEADIVVEAYNVAYAAHSDQRRYSGEPYIMHPVAVARILFDLGMDYQSLVAALLHDTVEDTSMSLEELSAEFGSEIATLVGGVTKLGKVPLATYKEQQAENIRKMLIAMNEDIRVIIIKLADRLHNMRTLEYMKEKKQQEKSLETLEIYAPIAHRLGISSIKEELEDLSIHYLDPFGYQAIERLLSENEEKHPTFISDTISYIEEQIKQFIPGAEVNGRRKSIYGIYRKMYMQGKEFDEIYDVYAIRVIVDNVSDCYNCLGIIHDRYHSLPGRFKDYISTPKSNMYQSLHTTVISEEKIPFEVQIRTREMHYTAEYGIAAHWKYKLGVKGNSKFEERLSWIRQLLDNQKDSDDVEDIVKTIKTDFVPDDVFVFTPKGDVLNVPYGSTVIDFAYAIHTEVGHHMNGAKVDGKIVPIDYRVKTGEIVEILTSPDPNKGPSRDWLKIVTTSSARSKIRSWFKKEKRTENIEQGKIELEKFLRRNSVKLFEKEHDELLKTLANRKDFDTVDDFLAAIGYRSVNLDNLLPIVKEEYGKILERHRKEEPEILENQQPVKKTSSEGVIVDGIDNCLIKFSKCCHPLPGDDIIGFITRGHGISIHKRDCNNVPKDIENSAEPERWVTVHWDKNVDEKFNSTLNIHCMNKLGMISDVTTDLASMHVNIQRLSMRDYDDGSACLKMTIRVNGLDHLSTVVNHLKKIEGVIDVERTGI